MTSSNTRELHLPEFPVGSPTNAAPHAVVLPRSSVMGLWSYSIRHRSGRFPASLGGMSCRKVTHMTHMASLPPTCALMKGEDIWIDKHIYIYVYHIYLTNLIQSILIYVSTHTSLNMIYALYFMNSLVCSSIGALEWVAKTRPLDHLTAVRAG